MYLGATTNERLNFGRYKHFHTSKPGVYKSPFHRGYIQNLVDLLGIGICGIYRPLKYEWTNAPQDWLSGDVRNVQPPEYSQFV